jgi:hypothetical protein
MLRITNWVCLLVLVAGAGTASPQERLTLEQALSRMPPDVAADIRKRIAAAPNPAPLDDASRQAVLDEFRAANPKQPPPRPARISGSGSAAARCVTGYVLKGSYSVSADDVRIVAERRHDCDTLGCRAFQVTTSRTSPEPYELDVSVTCSS